jgi:hypothetical protein
MPKRIANETISGSLNATGDISTSGILKSNFAGGDEGGQIDLIKAVTNTTLVTGVTIDVYQNKVRIFETGGTNRGVYLDLTSTATGVGTNILSGTGGISLTSLSAVGPIVYNNTTGVFSLGTIDGGRIV